MPNTEPNHGLLHRLRAGLNGPDVTPEGLALIVADWINDQTDGIIGDALMVRICEEIIGDAAVTVTARYTAALTVQRVTNIDLSVKGLDGV